MSFCSILHSIHKYKVNLLMVISALNGLTEIFISTSTLIFHFDQAAKINFVSLPPHLVLFLPLSVIKKTVHLSFFCCLCVKFNCKWSFIINDFHGKYSYFSLDITEKKKKLLCYLLIGKLWGFSQCFSLLSYFITFIESQKSPAI